MVFLGNMGLFWIRTCWDMWGLRVKGLVRLEGRVWCWGVGGLVCLWVFVLYGWEIRILN